MMPAYVVRQLLLTVLMAAAYFARPADGRRDRDDRCGLSRSGCRRSARLLLLNRRLAQRIAARSEGATSSRSGSLTALPILLVEGFYCCSPTPTCWCCSSSARPTKSRSITPRPRRWRWSPSSTTRSRRRPRTASASYHVAGDREGLVGLPRRSRSSGRSGRRSPRPCCCWRSASRSCACSAPQFTDGYHLMFILAVGLLARAAIGPIERLLNMLGEQRVCALRLCRRLRGQLRPLRHPDSACSALAGAAIATAVRLVIESIALFVVDQAAARLPRLHLGRCGALTRARHDRIRSFRVEWRPLAELGADRRRMAGAGGRARSSPTCSTNRPSRSRRAGVRTRASAPGWSGRAARRARLLGFFPARIERRRYGIPLPVLTGWTHPYRARSARRSSIATPASAVIAAWLDHVAGDRATCRSLMLLPYLPDGRRLGAGASGKRSTRRGGSAISFGRAPRARCWRQAAHARTTSTARSAARSARSCAGSASGSADARRADVGSTGESATPCCRAVGDFLALEAGGWKGRAGTAARDHDDIRKFLETAVTDACERRQGAGRPAVRSMTRPIAAIVVLRSGDDRLVLEDRLRRALRALLAGRAASARRDARAARRSERHPRGFLRRRRSSDDRPHLARAARARRPPGQRRPREQHGIPSRLRARNRPPRGGREREEAARPAAAEIADGTRY